VETHLLILNADPVFQDRAIAILDEIEGAETRIVRTMSEAVSVLLAEHFDAFVVEGESAIALEQATNARQHFPSLQIVCLTPKPDAEGFARSGERQKIVCLSADVSEARLRRELHNFVKSLDVGPSSASEGVDPCHSLIGNLNQFSAAEILQMSCLSQRSGRFTFTRFSANSKASLPSRKSSAGARAGSFSRKGSSARYRRSTAPGRTC
jgi:hypothetical protein